VRTAIQEHLRSLRWASWLGWQIESNWTEPWLFAIYVIAKPLAGMLILVFMFVAARSAAFGGIADSTFHYIYVSNACYMLVGAITFGMSWAVLADREHYEMLKYVYISPIRLRSYLVGRGLAGSFKAGLGALLLLLVGRWLGVPLRSGTILANGAWLLLFLALGGVMLAALGLILGGAVLNMARHGFFLSEGVAGTLYLFTGALFPISTLPAFLQPISLILPPTYWLEGLRRCFLGFETGAHYPFEAVSIGELALLLSLGTALLWVLAQAIFGWCERRAWQRGRLDQTSGY
jgi:ABC-2 type transport system permease protein